MSAREEAIGRLAKATKEAADDWGWKGGKPGEITGGQYQALIDKARKKETEAIIAALNSPAAKQLSPAQIEGIGWRAYIDAMYEPNQAVLRQFVGSRNKWFNDLNADDLNYTMGSLAEFEKAGVPREWTGKLLPAVEQHLMNTVDFASSSGRDIAMEVSNLMRPMTNDQRETFVNLLPRWTGTLEQAASAAKKLYRR